MMKREEEEDNKLAVEHSNAEQVMLFLSVSLGYVLFIYSNSLLLFLYHSPFFSHSPTLANSVIRV